MPQRLAYTVEEVADILDCGRTTVFKLIRTGRLRAVKIFGCRRVTDDDLRRMLAKLPSTRRKSAGPAERQDRRVSVEKLLSPSATLPESRRTRNAVGRPGQRGQHDDPSDNLDATAPSGAVRYPPDDVGHVGIDRHPRRQRGVRRCKI
jgi:excisionase family DNA binding protein